MISIEIKQEVLIWIAEGCDYTQGVELYRKYGKNMMLKRDFPNHQNRYSTKIVVELCKSVGLDYGEFLIDRNKNKEVNEVKEFKDGIPKQVRDDEPPELLQTKNPTEYPVIIRRVIAEYAESFQERSKMHRIMSEMPEGNSQTLKSKRAQLFDLVKSLTNRLEFLFNVQEEFNKSGHLPTEEEIWPKPKEKVVTELPDDGEQLRKMKKNQQSANTKDQNLLDYQSEKKCEVKRPMPSGPKRMKLENRIRARLKMIEEIDYKLLKI